MGIVQSGAVRLIAGAVLSGLATTGAMAMPVITVPAGLNDGDQYRLAFVTSTTRGAGSGNINAYNNFVTNAASTQAALVGLGTTWKAIASTANVQARDNTSTDPNTDSGVPIFLLNGSKLADNYADLWDGTVDNPLQIDETGSSVGIQLVWTGSRDDGTTLGGLGGSGASFGFAYVSGSSWIQAQAGNTGNPFSIYAMSDVLTVGATVGIAEPALLGVMASGLISLFVLRRKRIVPGARSHERRSN